MKLARTRKHRTAKRKTIKNRKNKSRRQRGGDLQEDLTQNLTSLLRNDPNRQDIEQFLGTIEHPLMHGMSPNSGNDPNTYHVIIHGEPHGDEDELRPIVFFTFKMTPSDDQFLNVSAELYNTSPQTLTDAYPNPRLRLGPLHNAICAAILDVYGVNT